MSALPARSPVAPDTSFALPGAPGDLERGLARWLASAEPALLPPDVAASVRLFVIDTLGVMLAATNAPGIRELGAAMGRLEPAGGPARAFSDGRGLTAPSAALMNGAAAHALDFDDQHDPARIHAYCVILPAAAAAAQEIGAVPGPTFVNAVALGVELFCRLGLACHNSLGKGWHPTTTLGSIAAAATVGKLLDLDEAGLLNAMGFGFVQLSGTRQFIADGVLAKRMGPGFAARNGLTAAYLAMAGLTAPWRFLTGEAGLFELHERGEADIEPLHQGLGAHWHLKDLSLKPFPCCRCNHTVIQLGLDLRAQGVALEDVVSGVIHLGRTNVRVVGAPFAPEQAPNAVVHAQFNACYALASAMRDGKVDFATYTRERVLNEAPAQARRFRVVEAEDIPPTAIEPARVVLTLRDGRSITHESATMRGAPADPLTRDEVLQKFAACLAHGGHGDAARSRRIAQALDELEQVDDVGALLAHLPD